jgi:hypothetical protein
MVIIYSLVARCKLKGIDPFTYFQDVLGRVSTHPASRIDDLLSSNWKKSKKSTDNTAAAYFFAGMLFVRMILCAMNIACDVLRIIHYKLFAEYLHFEHHNGYGSFAKEILQIDMHLLQRVSKAGKCLD